MCTSEKITWPSLVVFTITDICNQHCLFCAGVHRHKYVAKANVDAFKLPWLKNIPNIMLVGAGEALAHPQYEDILSTVRSFAPRAHIKLYTNGKALSGKILEATVNCVDSIYISQNSLQPHVYNSIIRGGDYAKAMSNLKELSLQKKRSNKDIHIILSFVGLRQNIHETKGFIDCASALGFEEVRLLKGFRPKHDDLPADSYLSMEEFNSLINIDQMIAYARKKGVVFSSNARFLNTISSGECKAPWEELRLIAVEGGWKINVCCRGDCNIFTTDEGLRSIEKFYTSDRFKFICKTINDPEKIVVNKMCFFCRLKLTNKDFFDRNDIILRHDKNTPSFSPLILDKDGIHPAS